MIISASRSTDIPAYYSEWFVNRIHDGFVLSLIHIYGKVNGFGNHDELLKCNEIYRSMYESQTKGGGDFDE